MNSYIPLDVRSSYSIGDSICQVPRLVRRAREMGFPARRGGSAAQGDGKKVMEIMLTLKDKFVAGCLENPDFRIGEWRDETAARSLSGKIWKDWEPFALYAFNKSHAVCYARLAYQTAYLKAHYPEEFAEAVGGKGG